MVYLTTVLIYTLGHKVVKLKLLFRNKICLSLVFVLVSKKRQLKSIVQLRFNSVEYLSESLC